MLKILDQTNRTVIVKMDKDFFTKIRMLQKNSTLSTLKEKELEKARRSASRSKKSFTDVKEVFNDILNS
jgi:hypothetical protein